MINIEETSTSFGADDLPADVLPHMIWNELLIGTVKKQVFLDLVQVSDILQGAVGTKVSVPIMSTRFSSSTISEATLDSSGYTFTEPTITDVDVEIGNQVYVAFKITDILKEDNPKYDWVRACLRDSGRAITEYRDAAIRDVLLAGAGNSISAATYGTLAYTDITSILAEFKIDSFYPEEVAPFLVIHPNQEKDLLNATTHTESTRYGVMSAEDIANSRLGVLPEKAYAGCRVRVSDNMTDALALVVFPSPHPSYGPITIHATKRPLTIKSEREETYGRQLWVTSIRYGTSVIQANGVGLISAC